MSKANNKPNLNLLVSILLMSLALLIGVVLVKNNQENRGMAKEYECRDNSDCGIRKVCKKNKCVNGINSAVIPTLKPTATSYAKPTVKGCLKNGRRAYRDSDCCSGNSNFFEKDGNQYCGDKIIPATSCECVDGYWVGHCPGYPSNCKHIIQI